MPCLHDQLGEAWGACEWGDRLYAGMEGRTDVVRVELVDADEHRDSGRPERPGGERADAGELAGVEVVYDDGVKLCGPVSVASHLHVIWVYGRVACLGRSCTLYCTTSPEQRPINTFPRDVNVNVRRCDCA